MVHVSNQDREVDKCAILQKRPMTTYSLDDHEEYKCSSKTSNNNNELMTVRQRQTEAQKNSHETTNQPINDQCFAYENDHNSIHHKEEDINFCSNMNSGAFRHGNETDSQLPSGTTENRLGDASNCYTLQGEFRRCGWNVAGANVLAVSCWIAKSQFLYARPRLTGTDFVIASIITLACGVLAR